MEMAGVLSLVTLQRSLVNTVKYREHLSSIGFQYLLDSLIFFAFFTKNMSNSGLNPNTVENCLSFGEIYLERQIFAFRLLHTVYFALNFIHDRHL